MNATQQQVADLAILNHGACAQCTRDGVIVWHSLEECARLHREQLAREAGRAAS